MKLKVASPWGGVDTYDTIEIYAERHLNGDDYNKGVVEAAYSTAQNNSKALGRLMDILAQKGLLTALETYKIIEGYDSGTADFEIHQND